MSSLRVRLAVLLVVAIVSVVTLVTGLVLALVSPPVSGRTVEPVARQLELIFKAADAHPAEFTLLPAPPPVPADASATRRLRAAIADGRRADLTVVRTLPSAPLQAALRIGGQGWLVVPVPDLPPEQGPLHVLLGWLGLITVGATSIAVYVARRMVQPLALLHDAVEKIGPDGAIPAVPEVGPAEVRATAKALNRLSARLKAAVDSRMRVVAAAGHDMRTPITRMRLRTEFIEDVGDRASWLRDIDELERIADSAIALVRASSSRFDLEALSLDGLVSEIASDLAGQGMNVTLASTFPVKVMADRLALTRAIRNLIINAATHGASARVRVEQPAPKRATIVIEDSGPGIPDDRLAQAFEPFFRVDRARKQTIPGAGLGLTIAREIVQLLGGTITIANRAEGGLRQTVELPAV